MMTNEQRMMWRCASEQGMHDLLWTVFEGEPFCSRRVASFADEQDAREYLYDVPKLQKRLHELDAECKQLRAGQDHYRQLCDAYKQAAYDAVLRAEQAEAECERLQGVVGRLRDALGRLVRAWDQRWKRENVSLAIEAGRKVLSGYVPLRDSPRLVVRTQTRPPLVIEEADDAK